MRFSAAVLAGGRSQRMGRDKALLPAPPFRTLFEQQLALLASVGPCERIASCRRRQSLPVPPGVRVAHDDGTAGPLGGLVAVLRAARTDSVLVLAVDLAWMSAWQLWRIVGAATDEPIGVIPRTAFGPQPLAALWPRSVLPLAEAQLAASDDRSLRTLVARASAGGMLRELAVPAADEPAFANGNYPRDFTRRPACPSVRTHLSH